MSVLQSGLVFIYSVVFIKFQLVIQVSCPRGRSGSGKEMEEKQESLRDTQMHPLPCPGMQTPFSWLLQAWRMQFACLCVQARVCPVRTVFSTGKGQ